MSWESFFQNLSNGISLGGLYALIAIGYSMVYGILRLINFAHGDIFMLGAYIAFYGILIFSLPWWLSLIVSIVLTAFIGMLIDKGAYKPLRNAPRISALITAIGVSFFLENLGLVIFGGRPKGFYRPPIFDEVITIKGVRILSLTFYSLLITLIFLMMLFYIVYKTKTGLGMRAVSTDMETARLMGIDVDKIISITFAIGSALAAVGGVLWAMKYPQINPLMGIFPGLKAFIAAVLGGIGSIGGALLGGFILGISEIMLVAFMPQLSGYRDAFAFLLLILILLVKPNGLLSVEVKEKT